MNKIEFVSYNGKYPTLCFGKLVVKIDDKEVSFGYTNKILGLDKLADYPKFWRSGGSVSFDENWNEEVIGDCDWKCQHRLKKTIHLKFGNCFQIF